MLKDRFLAMAAHDLRHPIQTIQLISELAILEHSEPESVRDFQEIAEANRLMAKMVDGFLNLAVLHSGNLQIDGQQADLKLLLEEIVRWLKLSAERKQVTLRLEPLPGPIRMSIDKAKIKQVMLNLVANAVEHGHPGQVVDIRVRTLSNQVQIEVADQGKGISPEDQARIFKAFARGSEDKSSGERGCGLGLYISHLIVTAHNGTLTVSSEVGKGSVFTVTLPLHKVDLSLEASGIRCDKLTA